MRCHSTRLRLFAAVVVAAAVLAACGDGGGTDSATSPSPSPEPSPNAESPEAMDGDMAMGGSDVTPADEIDGGEVVRGEFTILDTAPEGSTLSGTALLARTEDSTTVTLRLDGLEPGQAYVSHVHTDPCSESDGGPHYKHDPQGSDMPPNEIHLAFTGPDDGTIEWSVSNPTRANDDANSVVVHEDVEDAPRIACADLS